MNVPGPDWLGLVEILINLSGDAGYRFVCYQLVQNGEGQKSSQETDKFVSAAFSGIKDNQQNKEADHDDEPIFRKRGKELCCHR